MSEMQPKPNLRYTFSSRPLVWVLIAGLAWSWIAFIAHPEKARGLDDAAVSHPSDSSIAKPNPDDLNLSLEPYRQFPPPDDGQRHRILVIDQSIWGFVTTADQTPRKFLAQTPYALGPRDWTIWARPLQTEFDNFYVLLIVRYEATARVNGWAGRLPRPVTGPTDRRSEGIELNRLIRQQLAENKHPNPYGWNVHAAPEHLLQNILVITPPPVIYEPTTEVANGQTITRDPGQRRLTREFRILTKIDGVAVDSQAVSSQTVSYAQTKIVAIGVEYDNGHTVPEWQRPLLAEMAGVDLEDWDYVDYIIHHESRWKPRARNQSSGAYGLCQSLPARKMRSAGDDYQDNAITQLKWCHGYAQERYGGWEQAYNFWKRNYWW